MSALQIKDEERNSILNKIKDIRGQIVDVEILTKSKYNSQTPLKVQGVVEQLKQNIFDLDISITHRLTE